MGGCVSPLAGCTSVKPLDCIESVACRTRHEVPNPAFLKSQYVRVAGTATSARFRDDSELFFVDLRRACVPACGAGANIGETSVCRKNAQALVYLPQLNFISSDYATSAQRRIPAVFESIHGFSHRYHSH